MVVDGEFSRGLPESKYECHIWIGVGGMARIVESFFLGSPTLGVALLVSFEEPGEKACRAFEHPRSK